MLAKVDPIKMVRKSKKMSLDELDLDSIKLEKGDFSIEDLKDNGNNAKRHNLLKLVLDSSSACQLSDACNAVCGRSCVLEGIKSINNNKMYGKVFTARTNTDDWGTSLLAMDNAEEGDVLFLYCYGEPASVWGELASTCADEKGIKGTVLWGYARDIDALLYLDYPIFARDILPNAGKALGLGEIEVTVKLGDNIIKPGDFIFGDESGVVLVPQELFEDVIVQTFNILVKERNIIKKLKEGMLLSEAIGFKSTL